MLLINSITHPLITVASEEYPLEAGCHLHLIKEPKYSVSENASVALAM